MRCQPTHICHATSAALHRLYAEQGRISSHEPYAYHSRLSPYSAEEVGIGGGGSRWPGRNEINLCGPCTLVTWRNLCQGDDGAICGSHNDPTIAQQLPF